LEPDVDRVQKPTSRISGSAKKIGRNTFSSLRIRNYRLYFIGQGISLSGTWMQIIGQSWLVLKLSGSGTALGLVTALQFLPMLILAPWGGVVADRFNKRKLLYITQSAAGILGLVLGVLVATNLVKLWMVYVLAAALGLVNSIDNPTRQTFVYEVAGRDELRNAVTLNSTEINLTRVIGPVLAGVVIATLGLAPCFFINAASYTAILVCLIMMHSQELHTVEPVPRARGQLREGFRYVRNTPVLRDVLVMMAIIGTLTYEFQVTLPLLAKYTFHGNASSYAWLTAAMGGGAVLGGLVTASRRKSAPRELIVTALIFGVAVLLAAFSPSLATAILAMVFVGVFSIAFTALDNTILQLESAPNMRGRVMALWTVAFLGSTPIGGPLIGWIGEHFNPRWALAVGGFAALAAGLYGLLAMKGYPSHEVPADSTLQPSVSTKEDTQVL
jgi:MFS family permease